MPGIPGTIYLCRSHQWGYKGGMWLGALALVKPLVYQVAHGGSGREFGPDRVSLVLGAALIVLLNSRYRPTLAKTYNRSVNRAW
jgi:hypothetical protein